MEEKKQKELKDLEVIINNDTTIKENIRESLSNIKVDDEKIETLKKIKEDKDKDKKENEKKINEEEQNKKIKEEEIKNEDKKIKEAQKKLNEKNKLIESKQKEISELTNVLEKNIKNEKKRLEDEKSKIENELKVYKQDALKQFLTIKIINEEVKKLTLNKDTINSVSELINEFSLDKQFIDNRQYFDEIIKEYENIITEIEQSNGKSGEIYRRYNLDPDSIRKIEKPKQVINIKALKI